jgi:ParB family chromosome partitioning protein
LQELAIGSISANPYQARTVWNDQDLAELADSIRVNGILQPILVRRFQGGYQLIAGERRFRAAQAAGLPKVPALVREVAISPHFP